MTTTMPLSMLSTYELVSFGNRLVEILRTHFGNDPYAGELIALLTAKLEELSQAIGNTAGSKYTPLLEAEDQQRDEDYLLLRDLAGAYTHAREADRKQAANLLFDQLKQIGLTLYKEGYANESAKLSALFEKFDAPEHQNALALLNLAGVYNNLKESQNSFEQTIRQRIAEESAKEVPLVIAVKHDVRKLIVPLLMFVGTQAHLGKSPAVETNALLNQLANETIVVLRARQTREAKEKENNKTANA
ncbi:MAG: hypothetical protein HC896_06495 [Bacteroidales bacterium]|nr:hypothetical protein [Bacteroidales bacterium]